MFFFFLKSSVLSRQELTFGALGRIGRSVVRRLSGFEAQVLVATSRPDADYAARTGVRFVDLEEVLEARTDATAGEVGEFSPSEPRASDHARRSRSVASETDPCSAMCRRRRSRNCCLRFETALKRPLQ